MARAAAPVMGRDTRSEGVHCLRIGCSTPSHKNKRGNCETRAWPRCPWITGPGRSIHKQQQHPAQTNFAHNFPRSFFETTRKRCNSNDAHSMFEQAAGELRAKLLGDRGAWLRCPWAVAGPGRTSRRRAEPKARSADGERAGRRPRAHKAARPSRAHKAARPTSTTQRNEAATGFPATASSRSRSAVHNSTAADQAVMST